MHFHYDAIPQDLINVDDNRERGFDSWFAPEDSKRLKEVPTGYGLMHNKQQLIAMIINALIIDDSL